MTKTFTRNEMIRYFYDEMSDDETAAFQQQLGTDPAFRSEFSEFVSTLENLDKVMVTPSERVVHNIMNFSGNYEKNHQKV